MEERFYLCEVCGNLAIMAIASGITMECCGEKMTKLEANVSDAGHEKHVPIVVSVDCHSMKVRVGSNEHPMTEEHHIKFICLHTTKECIIRHLQIDEKPEACIRFSGTPIAVYAYCNKHGLWKANIENEKVC